MKELKQRLLYFAECLKEKEEYIDHYTMGKWEVEMAKVKEETMHEVGDMLLEILELDNKTFKNWLAQEEDE
tara:strand:+ start:958 stop:1170 length:213 start_codon:yes stop_codon:yes gene_type:complete